MGRERETKGESRHRGAAKDTARSRRSGGSKITELRYDSLVRCTAVVVLAVVLGRSRHHHMNHWYPTKPGLPVKGPAQDKKEKHNKKNSFFFPRLDISLFVILSVAIRLHPFHFLLEIKHPTRSSVGRKCATMDYPKIISRLSVHVTTSAPIFFFSPIDSLGSSCLDNV